jgi:hypothetical protein
MIAFHSHVQATSAEAPQPSEVAAQAFKLEVEGPEQARDSPAAVAPTPDQAEDEKLVGIPLLNDDAVKEVRRMCGHPRNLGEVEKGEIFPADRHPHFLQGVFHPKKF